MMQRWMAVMGLAGLLLARPVQAAEMPPIPGDAMMVTHVKLAKLWNTPGMEPYRKNMAAAGEQVLKMLDQRFHPAPSSVQTVTVFLPKPAPMAERFEPNPVVIITTSKPMNAAKVARSYMHPEDVVEKTPGKMYTNDDGKFVLAFPDDRTVIAGETQQVLPLLAGTYPRKGPIADLLSTVGDADLIVGVNRMAIPELPPDLPPAMQTLMAMRTASLTMSVSKTSQIRLAMNYANGDAAEEAKQVGEQFLALGGQYLATLKGPLLKELLVPEPTEGSTISGLPMATGALVGLGAINTVLEWLESPLLKVNGSSLVFELDITDGDLSSVVAASGVAAGLMVPAVSKIREAAARTQSQNNLKQIGLALHNYHDANNSFPPAIVYDKNGKALYSWRVLILPYMEQEAIYRQFKLDEPWDSPNNKPLSDVAIKIFRTPTSKTSTPNTTGYRLIIGNVGEKKTDLWRPLFGDGKSRTRFANITDGTSNTIMVVETADEVPWAKPDEIVMKPGQPLPKFGGYYAGGFNALFGDGSVRFISEKVDARVLRLLIAADDGIPIPNID
ncbi:DUF1559 domain-containing protein [Tuwongella immobilis]|uniref:DUF1559 domain-containing protein n=1 Tax=Tuwongella immobilis TaxID=692036 RepID=A0A6C2YT19_9BACT|nr:DUF1559 domain-containing protein [Tuwongella immobilis]VIP04606.1 Uncharacterized protein OS=Planctomyces maris DSM 8797 GN=PM8797T_28794 PE=4 SV=1: SBP_bac_10: SBP_bac_10 [Tuwongella immobilis]VTS06573.1 Uncharacterized protein OS=Planctomyces maris DSM 8797 GN=PM8797T_28794 PE=4 SV=1: SBP_bac_10: SBP_bac_10 [Tuwongella immobilis]